MTRYFILAVFILLISLSTLHASSNKALDGLELLRKGFADVNDFSAEIIQEKQLSLLKRTQTARGVIRFRRPGLFYMELYPPYASRLLLNDNILDLYLVKEKISQHIVLPPDQSLKYWFELVSRPVVKLPDGVDIRADQSGPNCTLTITPRTKGQVKSFVVTLTGEGRLKKLVIEEQNRDRTVITIQKMVKNRGVADKDFRVQ